MYLHLNAHGFIFFKPLISIILSLIHWEEMFSFSWTSSRCGSKVLTPSFTIFFVKDSKLCHFSRTVKLFADSCPLKFCTTDLPQQTVIVEHVIKTISMSFMVIMSDWWQFTGSYSISWNLHSICVVSIEKLVVLESYHFLNKS